MCIDPVTAISLGSGALGAAGALAGGSANARAAGIAAQAAQANSQMALSEASGQQAQIDLRVNNAIGRTRASAGAGNIEIGSGSPLAMSVMSAQQGNTDKQLVMARALNQSAGQSFQASTDYQRVGQSQMAGILGAGTSMLQSLAFSSRAGGLAGGGGFGGGFNMAPGFMTGAYGF